MSNPGENQPFKLEHEGGEVTILPSGGLVVKAVNGVTIETDAAGKFLDVKGVETWGLADLAQVTTLETTTSGTYVSHKITFQCGGKAIIEYNNGVFANLDSSDGVRLSVPASLRATALLGGKKDE